MKFADILCEPGPRPNAVPAYERRWSRMCPRHSPDASPERRHTSCPSPVRVGVDGDWTEPERKHSPILTVPRNRAPAQTECTLPPAHPPSPPPPHDLPFSRRQRHPLRRCSMFCRAVGCGGMGAMTARPGFTRLSAYFSTRPPAAPLKLVPVLLPAPAPLTPSLRPTHSSTSSPPIPTCNSSPTASQFDEVAINEKCKLAVRSVLCELMAALPLSAPPSPPPPRKARVAASQRKTPPDESALNSDTNELRKASPTDQTRGKTAMPSMVEAAAKSGSGGNVGARCAWSASSGSSSHTSADSEPTRKDPLRPRRHASTQAPLSGCARHGKLQGENTSGTEHERTAGPDEWLGGVRALRDSHVRLVLRQLRHIERLNRALDRASCTGHGSKKINATGLDATPFTATPTVPSLVTKHRASLRGRSLSPPVNYDFASNSTH